MNNIHGPIPLLPPPPGVTPNFVDPPTRKTELVVNCVLTPALAMLFVTARISSRIISTKLGWDDYTCIAAMALSIAYSAVLIHHTEFGEGRHGWDVPLDLFFPGFQKWEIVVAELACGLTLASKMSVLLLLHRIFGVNKTFAMANYIVMFFVVGYIVPGIFSIVFQCRPPAAAWNPSVKGSCIDTLLAATVAAGFNVLTDVAILLLPQPMVWQLQLKSRVKIGLAMVFLTGGAICIVSIARLCLFVGNKNDPDFTWTIVTLDVASVWEGNVSIICGCLPVIKPLITRFAPTIWGSTFVRTYFSGAGTTSRTPKRGSSMPQSTDPSSITNKSIIKSTTLSTQASQITNSTQLSTQKDNRDDWPQYLQGLHSPIKEKPMDEEHGFKTIPISK